MVTARAENQTDCFESESDLVVEFQAEFGRRLNNQQAQTDCHLPPPQQQAVFTRDARYPQRPFNVIILYLFLVFP